MTIGQVAKQAGVNVQTIRFYERKGLVAPASRTASGYRQYGTEAVSRIQFIKHAQEVGFTLREIDELLSLRLDADTRCGDIRRHALQKIDEINDRMARLTEMKEVLSTLAEQCSVTKNLSDCPILDALDAQRASLGGD